MLSGGEALLHTPPLGPLRPLREAGIGITLLSTGLLLARDAAELVRWCDDVVVSLDGPRQVHDRIRNMPRAYDKLAEGVAAVRAAGPGVTVTGRCTVQRANFRELCATVARRSRARARPHQLPRRRRVERSLQPAGRLGCLARLRRRPRARRGSPMLAAELLALDPRACRRLRLRLHRREPGEARSAPPLATSPPLAGEGDFHPVECNAPWVSSVIEADGTVRPCFFQPPLGNLTDGRTFTAILNGPQAVAWRRGLDVERDAICRRCVCSLSLREAPR